MRVSATALAFGAVALAGLVLASLGDPAPPVPRPTPTAEPVVVRGGGVTLTSAEIALPEDAGVLPPGPGHDLVAAKCTACHSAEMITTQPPLTPAQWAATVKKMREVYQAPVAAAEDAAIVAYLGAVNGASTRPAQSTDR